MMSIAWDFSKDRLKNHQHAYGLGFKQSSVNHTIQRFRSVTEEEMKILFDSWQAKKHKATQNGQSKYCKVSKYYIIIYILFQT